MGTVARVLPGMQAAFVEMGLNRAAFLHVSDMGLIVDEYGQPGIIPESEEVGLITDLFKRKSNHCSSSH